MSNISKWLKDRFGRTIFPRTLDECVYDENGNFIKDTYLHGKGGKLGGKSNNRGVLFSADENGSDEDQEVLVMHDAYRTSVNPKGVKSSGGGSTEYVFMSYDGVFGSYQSKTTWDISTPTGEAKFSNVETEDGVKLSRRFIQTPHYVQNDESIGTWEYTYSGSTEKGKVYQVLVSHLNAGSRLPIPSSAEFLSVSGMAEVYVKPKDGAQQLKGWYPIGGIESYGSSESLTNSEGILFTVPFSIEDLGSVWELNCKARLGKDGAQIYDSAVVNRWRAIVTFFVPDSQAQSLDDEDGIEITE